MSYKECLTTEYLKSRIRYDQSTGFFYRLPSNSRIIFNEISSSRLIKLTKDGKQYRIPAHNLAWLFSYGKYPDGVIMHRNMNKTDFRLCNLKQVTIRHLNRATLMYKDYTQGYKPKPHETDMHKYVVKYYDGKSKQHIFEDYFVALTFSEKIELMMKKKLQQLGVDV